VQVFENRHNLLRTLRDSETVVAQVELVIGIVLFIIWLFITAAIFDGEAVQRTWTALSAGLLSFSFIFGNSIREVCLTPQLCLQPYMLICTDLDSMIGCQGNKHAIQRRSAICNENEACRVAEGDAGWTQFEDVYP
jgi:hypothetical protein